MKICYLAGANSIHSYRWIKFFVEAGHEIAWVSLAPSIFKPLHGIYYYEIEWAIGPLNLIRAVAKIRRVISEFKPDVLHVHSVGTYGLMGLLSGFKNIIATPWGSDIILGKASPMKRLIISRILNKATMITCDAIHMRDEVVRFGVPMERIQIINFGIDTDRFSPGPPDEAFRSDNDLKEGLIVISLRNLESIYDVSTLIKAVPKVLQRHPDTRFIIVGKGSLQMELQSLAHNLGIDYAVKFLGYIPNDQLVHVLRSVDVYVSTSLSDAGIAASTAEAMACGLPVIVTDSGENARWLSDGMKVVSRMFRTFDPGLCPSE
jgi:glycosyltransferase involved in cell wall biosynthesis